MQIKTLSYLFLLFLLPSALIAETRILFLVDASASMKSELSSGISKISAVKAVLTNELLRLKEIGVPVALRVFGHRQSYFDKVASCSDSELLWEFQSQQDLLALDKNVQSINPQGLTSLAYNLQQLPQDLLYQEKTATVILLTDGQESCGGNPVAVLKNLEEQGFKIVLQIIGLQIASSEEAALKELAHASGGNFYNTKDAVAFLETLESISASSLDEDSQQRWQGVVTKGDAGQQDAGNDINSALAIRPTIYKNNSLGSLDNKDIFKLKGQTGEKFTIHILRNKPGIDWRLKVFDGNQQTLLEQEIKELEFNSEPLILQNRGDFYIEISLAEVSKVRAAYSLEIQQLVSF